VEVRLASMMRAPSFRALCFDTLFASVRLALSKTKLTTESIIQASVAHFDASMKTYHATKANKSLRGCLIWRKEMESKTSRFQVLLK